MNERLTPEQREIVENAKRVLAEAEALLDAQLKSVPVDDMSMEQYAYWRRRNPLIIG